jgi:hypothetical protein
VRGHEVGDERGRLAGVPVEVVVLIRKQVQLAAPEAGDVLLGSARLVGMSASAEPWMRLTGAV